MRVYEVTVIDRVASREGEEPVKYESYVAVGTDEELAESGRESRFLPAPFIDENIHYYFTREEWAEDLQDDGTIETECFTYWVGERAA